MQVPFCHVHAKDECVVLSEELCEGVLVASIVAKYWMYKWELEWEGSKNPKLLSESRVIDLIKQIH